MCSGRCHRLAYADYAAFLAESDVLLSLMLSPHTSYPPLEMATAGGIVITNTFSTKTAADLSAISTAIRGTPPDVDHLSTAIVQAAADVSDGRLEPARDGPARHLGRIDGWRRALARGSDRIGPRRVASLTSTSATVERPARAVFVASRDEVPPPGDGVLYLVIDTAWTPSAAERRDVLSVRPVIARVVERVDLFEDALERLDLWASASGVIERTTLDGLSLWHGIREPMWRWLHERLLWAFVVEAIARDHDVTDFECDPAQAALRQVLEARGDGTAVVSRTLEQPGAMASAVADPAPTGTDRRAVTALAAVARRVRRRVRGLRSSSSATVGSDTEALDARVRAAAAHEGRGVLVLSYVRVAQTVGRGGTSRIVDPHLDAVVDRLGAVGMVPIILALGLDRRDPAARAAVAADERLVPGWLLPTRWGSDGPDVEAETAAAQAVDDRLAAAPSPTLRVAGADLGPPLRAEVRRLAAASGSAHQRLRPRVDALLDEIRPTAVLMTHEGLRGTWLAAASGHGIPTFAVQHGIIYATHPGYRHQRQPGLILPTETFVYGPFERRTLLDAGGYESDEVTVSGSPRLDLDSRSAFDATASPDRGLVRSELGVADDHRLLVVSTLFDPFIRWSHLTHMLECTLGGPLPRVHVVFKLHPGETDDGPYRALLTGLAAAGGYEPPPMSVIRDIDLYRLLRAADAHLGMHSTVLTDAVVVGTPNLIATVDAHSDILGYVPAGVARPVRDVVGLLAALDDPWPPDPVARQAFLEEHFRSGDASALIADAISAGRAVTR